MRENRVESIVKIHSEKGLHVRIAAMLVQKADRLRRKYQADFYIKREGFRDVPLTSLLLVTSMRIKKDEEILLITQGKNVEQAAAEMKAFLESDFLESERNMDQAELSQVDTLLQEHMITAENIYSSIASGLIVTDKQDTIVIYNREAEKLLGISDREALGQNIREVFGDSRMTQAMQGKEAVIGYTQTIGKSTMVGNTMPILENGERKGTITTLEDVSQLVQISWEFEEVKELKEKYYQILEAVQDGICVFDQKGIVTYVNGAYETITGDKVREGAEILAFDEDGSAGKILEKGQKIMGAICRKKNGKSVVLNLVPIIVNQQIMGGISVVKSLGEVQELVERIQQLSAKTEYLEEELNRRNKLNPAFNRIVGVSSKLYEAMQLAAKTADNNFNVLIRGESGTGKELIAEAIHYSSQRANHDFIRVNCAAIPENLLESEMFGHVKGAYTGAIKTKIGKFELAHKGTIFLDEIGELDKSMQAKMLRVIQKKEFQRVGDDRTIQVDARIIAATNRNLEELVEKGEFREDLYYRLNVIPIWLPPLRERREDIPVLAEYFLNKIGEELGREPKYLAPDAMEAVLHYSWPGNIRELENVMERVHILADGNQICRKDLPHYICENYINETYISGPYREERPDSKGEIGEKDGKKTGNFEPEKEGDAQGQNREKTGKFSSSIWTEDRIYPWECYEKEIIQRALKEYGSYNAAGKALGLTHKTVAAKARKYQLE
ncbi:MAG: sigma 54-interacting transcriptional regulator [Lachnospiraceae bacterium]|nr:sigma 54-interacting transcriptional regulator [Lachnospiraceae bacterium]